MVSCFYRPLLTTKRFTNFPWYFSIHFNFCNSLDSWNRFLNLRFISIHLIFRYSKVGRWTWIKSSGIIFLHDIYLYLGLFGCRRRWTELIGWVFVNHSWLRLCLIKTVSLERFLTSLITYFYCTTQWIVLSSFHTADPYWWSLVCQPKCLHAFQTSTNKEVIGWMTIQVCLDNK